MNVLVVGGAGHLGGGITDQLLKTEHPFIVYDNLLYEREYRKPCSFVYGDVRNKTLLKTHLDWADVVIWIAAIVGDACCAVNEQVTREINESMILFLVNNFNGRIIFTSTCSVYGQAKDIATEESVLNPLSIYAETKIQGEKYIKDKDNSLIFRLGTLYGLSDLYSRPRFDLIVNSLTKDMHFKNKISVYKGEQYRPLLHVKDAAEVIVGSVDSSICGIFNLHESNKKILDIGNAIVSHYTRGVVEVSDFMFEDFRNYKVSSKYFADTTGWNPKYSIHNGIAEFKKLFDSRRIVNIDDPRYNPPIFLNTVDL